MASVPRSSRGQPAFGLKSGLRFLYGVLGAASPEVIRWSKIALHYKLTDLPDSWLLYLIVTTVFVVVGGFFSTLWEDNNRIKCFYFGLTFPLFVSAMLASGPNFPTSSINRSVAHHHLTKRG